MIVRCKRRCQRRLALPCGRKRWRRGGPAKVSAKIEPCVREFSSCMVPASSSYAESRSTPFLGLMMSAGVSLATAARRYHRLIWWAAVECTASRLQ